MFICWNACQIIMIYQNLSIVAEYFIFGYKMCITYSVGSFLHSGNTPVKALAHGTVL